MSLGPAKKPQRKMASMIPIKSEEILSVKSLTYLRAIPFEILVEEEAFESFLVPLPQNKCFFADKSKKQKIIN